MAVCRHGSVVLLSSGGDENDSFRAVTGLGLLVYQLSRKSNPVFRMLLLVLN